VCCETASGTSARAVLEPSQWRHLLTNALGSHAIESRAFLVLVSICRRPQIIKSRGGLATLGLSNRRSLAVTSARSLDCLCCWTERDPMDKRTSEVTVALTVAKFVFSSARLTHRHSDALAVAEADPYWRVGD
jgi:hypothetical protein